MEILNGKSQNEVAKRHQIAKTTIWRIIKKITPEERERISSEGISDEIVERLVLLSKKRSSGSFNNSTMDIIVKDEDEISTTRSVRTRQQMKD